MWCIRAYKSMKTNKLKAVKLVNENTMQCQFVTCKDLKKVLSIQPDAVFNIEVDNSGNPKIKDMNPSQKIKYYEKTFVYDKDMQVNHYCIILGFTGNGTLKFVADGKGKDAVMYGSDATLGEISGLLGINGLDNLKLYNAIIKNECDEYSAYIFDGNDYRKLGKLRVNSINNIFGHDWDVKIKGIAQQGLSVEYLKNKKRIKSYHVPVGVSHIEKFGGGVKTLALPPSLTSLGRGCFGNIKDLENITLEKCSITEIPMGCFLNSSLEHIKFSGRETEIGEYAFQNCNKLQGAIVTSARVIHRKAFCNSSIELLSLLEADTIEHSAFAQCKKLYKVKMNKVERIEDKAFEDCKNLLEISLPNTIKYIGKDAFKGCNIMSLIRIPKGTTVHPQAFEASVKRIFVERD